MVLQNKTGGSPLIGTTSFLCYTLLVFKIDFGLLSLRLESFNQYSDIVYAMLFNAVLISWMHANASL